LISFSNTSNNKDTDNSTWPLSVHCYNIETRKSNKIEIKNKDIEYIPRIYYANSSEALVIATLNRAQNRLEFILANPKTTIIKSLYIDESTSWIDEICYNNVKFALHKE
jgi:dipeptidyl-peptidase-4